MRWVPIAAMLGMAATIFGWVFTTGTGRNRTASATHNCGDAFSRCMTGPNGMIKSGCDTCDYNADGHIDMLDASTHQLSGNGITR